MWKECGLIIDWIEHETGTCNSVYLRLTFISSSKQQLMEKTKSRKIFALVQLLTNKQYKTSWRMKKKTQIVKVRLEVVRPNLGL